MRVNGLLFGVLVAVVVSQIMLPNEVAAQTCDPEELYRFSPNTGADHAQFGWSVGVNGSKCIVGAVGRFDTGAAYIFDLNTGRRIHRIVPEDGSTVDWFGSSVDLDGDIAIIGAYGDDD